MNTKEIQDSIIEDFSVFDNWMDKYQYIMELGKELEALPDNQKKEEYLVNGCQSKVWVIPEYKDGKLFFKADSDAFITKGIVALLLKVFNEKTPDEILNTELYFIKELGLSEHLSMNRANGLNGMIEKIIEYAKQYKKSNYGGK